MANYYVIFSHLLFFAFPRLLLRVLLLLFFILINNSASAPKSRNEYVSRHITTTTFHISHTRFAVDSSLSHPKPGQSLEKVPFSTNNSSSFDTDDEVARTRIRWGRNDGSEWYRTIAVHSPYTLLGYDCHYHQNNCRDVQFTLYS